MVIRRRDAGSRRGQALAEFALVIPVFMLVLGGVIQFGIWFWDQNTLNQIARDAGRYAATVKCTGSSQGDIVSKTQALEASTPFAGTFGAVIVVIPTPVEATVPTFFPFVNGNISSSAKYRMEPYAG
jgi:Flp pilus assembly protein TadG